MSDYEPLEPLTDVDPGDEDDPGWDDAEAFTGWLSREWGES